MKTNEIKLRTITQVIALAAVALTVAACGGRASTQPGDQSTPTLAYKALYEAVKKKDHEGIKKTLSKGTLEMMEGYAGMQKKTLNDVIENGLTETTFAPKLPATQNEKITGEFAILEVKNEKSGSWEKLPFAREDGKWKLAIDTFFKGTMSPSGPTNPEHPGQLPPGTETGPPQNTPPGPQKPSLKEQGENPATPSEATPGSPGPKPAPTPTTEGVKPGVRPPKNIKPPTR